MKYLKWFRENEITDNSKLDELRQHYHFICAKEDKGVRVGKDNSCFCVYNIPEDLVNTEVSVINMNTGTTFATYCLDMIVDGESKTPSKTYTFETSGEHTIKFIFKHTLSTLSYMFNNITTLVSFDGSELDTYSATSLSYMFSGCTNLTEANVGNFDTRNVIYMGATFARTNIQTVDVSKWDTSNVTNINSMFSNASALTYVDVSNWDTSHIVSAYSVFNSCASLPTVDVSKWNTSNVTNTQSMFNNANNLTYVDVSKWNVSKLGNCSWMFARCSKLESVDLTNWKTDSLVNCSNMFSFATHTGNTPTWSTVLTSVGKLDNWNMSNVTTLESMFDNCSGLTSVGDISHWNITNKLTTLNHTFYNCNKLTHIGDISNWDVSNVKTFNNTFYSCSKITSLGDLGKWNITTKTTSMYNCFRNCKNIISFGDISNWNVSKITNATYIFWNCASITDFGDLTKWTNSNSSAVFDAAFQYTKISEVKFITRNRIDWQIYYGCPNITEITIPDNIISMGNLCFCFCGKLAKVTYKGVTYTSAKSAIEALRANGVQISTDSAQLPFVNTPLASADVSTHDLYEDE